MSAFAAPSAAVTPPHPPRSGRQPEQGPRAFASSAPLSAAQLVGAPVRLPRPSRLARPPQAQTKKVGVALQALGIHSLRDLLEHLPRERRDMLRVRELSPGEPATVAVEVRAIRARSLRRRGMRPLVEATVFDESGQTRAAFFNQPWLVGRYPAGTRLLLHGKLDGSGVLRVWSHSPDGGPQAEGGETSSAADGEGAISHYPASEGVSSTQLASLVRAARPALADLSDALPARVRHANRLPDRAAALEVLHFSEHPQERELGRTRLAFEELLLGQLLLRRRRALRGSRRSAFVLGDPGSLSDRWLRRGLPFALTSDQRAATRAIDIDLAHGSPMQRLLIGEVGSGKTVVALYALLRAFEHGRQGALMAPTETLAEQHLATLRTLLGAEVVPVALLTASTARGERRRLEAALAEGRPGIVVGTHALIEPDVRFGSLALVVVDEQHRFGVRQRTQLDERGEQDGEATGAPRPHVLHMTATPIPRTLALAAYGDLDLSLLRELPRGRQPVSTRIVAGAAPRRRAYAALREQLEAGRQAYVVCPLVSEPDAQVEDERQPDATDGGEPGGDAAAELRAACEELERLAGGELAGFTLALMHGQMRAREKQAAMAAFIAGEAQVLVSTTVIEVGIDVPNASVMLVENAERFGISQLHQLRGRVGRGAHRSECMLMTSPRSARSPRLRALAAHSDGFRLAEIDLELRGRGELTGNRQSGAVAHRVARLPEDAVLLEEARARAESIMASDPDLEAAEHALLRDELARHFGGEALAPIRP
jgi:ATP-dependent DNA helicase RecG